MPALYSAKEPIEDKKALQNVDYHTL